MFFGVPVLVGSKDYTAKLLYLTPGKNLKIGKQWHVSHRLDVLKKQKYAEKISMSSFCLRNMTMLPY